MEKIKTSLKKIIPTPIFRFFQPIYHYKLALLGAIIYRFPARELFVIGVTGTKGKSSTTEVINSILEHAGYKTALSNTIRFKIGERSRPNLYKMSMPGLFFMQNFLRRAANADCTHAVVEMTSEGARQFRHKFIPLDAFVFTNLSPEHIESHGSYEKYVAAKMSIARQLETSRKPHKILIVNGDDPEMPRFFALNVPHKFLYKIESARPFSPGEAVKSPGANAGTGAFFTFRGVKIQPKIFGLFNIYNCLAAATLSYEMGIPVEKIKEGIESVEGIAGRVQKIEIAGGRNSRQNFGAYVDYAHTPDSLEKLYQAFPNERKICVLGNTGGGRDTWKRPEMARIAEKYCDQIILTNEDPYDEDPAKIVAEMRAAITRKPCEIIMDRRQAIARALALARASAKGAGTVAVLISGKGTDPYIMGPRGSKQIWSDADVVREELEKIAA